MISNGRSPGRSAHSISSINGPMLSRSSWIGNTTLTATGGESEAEAQSRIVSIIAAAVQSRMVRPGPAIVCGDEVWTAGERHSIVEDQPALPRYVAVIDQL